MEAMHQFIGMLAHCPVFLCYSLARMPVIQACARKTNDEAVRSVVSVFNQCNGVLLFTQTVLEGKLSKER
jgi:hypothetical protein